MPPKPKTFDLDFLLSLSDEGQFYNLVSEKFNEINGDFYARANLTLLERLHLKSNSKVMDLACGTGHLAIEIAKRVPQGKVVGVDMASEMLAKGREDAALAKVQNVEFVQRDITHILPEFKPGDFNVGVSCFALSYLGTDFLLKEMYQILGNQGQIGITTSSVASLVEWQPLLFEYFSEHPEQINEYGSQQIVEMPLNAEDLKERVEAAGFKNAKVESLRVPLAFKDGADAASFLIGSGWISNGFYKIPDRQSRETLIEWALAKLKGIQQGAPKLETSIEFLIAWNEI